MGIKRVAKIPSTRQIFVGVPFILPSNPSPFIKLFTGGGDYLEIRQWKERDYLGKACPGPCSIEDLISLKIHVHSLLKQILQPEELSRCELQILSLT